MAITTLPDWILKNLTVSTVCDKCGDKGTINIAELWHKVMRDVTWESEIKPSKGITIEYVSSTREITQRLIIPQRAQGFVVNGGKMIKDFEAFCTVRKAMRTFIPDKIIACTDAETGKKVSNPSQWLLDHCKN